MPINTQPSNLLGYLRDQKYVGGDNTVGNVLKNFLTTYLAAKEQQDEEGVEGAEGAGEIKGGDSVAATGDVGGADAGGTEALAAKLLGQGGTVSPEMVQQSESSAQARKKGGLERFAKAFLGNQHEFEDLTLKSKAAQLESQNLKNQDASAYLNESPLLAKKLLQAQNGMDVDATGLTHPKLLKEFNATSGVIKTGNKLDSLLGGIQGEAWQSPDTFQKLSQFWAQNPFLNKEQSGALKNALSHVRKNIEVKGDDDPGDGRFLEDLVTGDRFLARGKQTLRSGTNPALGGPSKFDTAETSSLFRRLEKIESDIRRGKSAAGLRYKPEDLLRLNSEKEQLKTQIEGKRPGQKKIEAPQLSVAPTATNPQTGEKLQFINGQWQPLE